MNLKAEAYVIISISINLWARPTLSVSVWDEVHISINMQARPTSVPVLGEAHIYISISCGEES